MRSLLINLSIFFLILFLISCGPSNTVKVESFIPAGEVQNLTNFTIEFSEDLAPADVQEYDFHTPYFDVTKVDFFWTNIPYQNYKLSVQANIYFNYAVDPKSLK